MKKIYLLVLLLFALSIITLAQSVADKPLEINAISQQDTVPTNWKIRAGNNPQYALPGFDDKKWVSFAFLDSVIMDNKADDFWLRLHLTIGSSLKTDDFAFSIFQNAASVIYLDGRPFKTFGAITGEVRLYNPVGEPVAVTLSPGEHVIAVHLVVSKYLLKYKELGNSFYVFYMAVNTQNNVVTNYKQTVETDNRVMGENLLLIGMFFILTVTHLASYLYYRKQKAHLYYAVITFILLFATYTNFMCTQQHSPVIVFWLSFIGVLGFIGFVFLPLTIYELFNYSNRLAIKIILIFCALALPVIWINATYGFYLLFFVTPLINAVECLRVGILSFRKKKSGALFVVTGSFLFLTLLVAANLIPNDFGEVLFMLSLISLPIGMTVFLAIRTAITYGSLEVKLVEVQELSHQNMQFQLEKQQMLARQNAVLEEQVIERTTALSNSLAHLKATQSQLIQAEKMASLGELTAGIAHEIQNPLNFVNNFSEVNMELLDEMKEEMQSGKIDDALAIADDIKGNQQKITEHGKRADNIVKGMLQHSKQGSGTMEPTNLNAMSDELLRRSYSGFRAKDKLFTAELIIHFDENLPMTNLVPQDISRVLLNLFNNAFYAVNQKQKTAGVGYKPEVSVTTSAENGQVIIAVADNGVGIPDAIKDKIMQPFFTTKPTGEGTGLGLSLTYDMVVKGHGGSIQIESTEGQGSEFIIKLHVLK